MNSGGDVLSRRSGRAGAAKAARWQGRRATAVDDRAGGRAALPARRHGRLAAGSGADGLQPDADAPLRPASFLWTQLPPASRACVTRGEKVIPVWSQGNKPHAIDFHTFYTAQLGSNGKDEFLFKLEARPPSRWC